MALITFAPETSENEVPWIAQYLDENGTEGDSFPVTMVSKSSKGFLILTDHFKGFLFEKSSVYKFLDEALSYWVSNQGINYPLFAIADKGGKLQLAVDDELEPSLWTKSGMKFEQKLKKSLASSSTTPKSNPFLPTPPPTPSNGKKAR